MKTLAALAALAQALVVMGEDAPVERRGGGFGGYGGGGHGWGGSGHKPFGDGASGCAVSPLS